MLVNLLFACRATDRAQHDLSRILKDAHAYNAEHGITGVLCYSGALWMHLIEGSRSAVNCLYGHILLEKDYYTDVELLHYAEINERMYGSWTMGQVDMARLSKSIVLKYSETSTFNPYAVPGSTSVAMLRELMETASIVTSHSAHTG